MKPACAFVDGLARGKGFEESVVELVRGLTASGLNLNARALAQGLQTSDSLREVGRLAEAVAAVGNQAVQLAWARFEGAPLGVACRLCPGEIATVAAYVRPESLDEIYQLILSDHAQCPPAGLLQVVRVLFATGRLLEASTLATRIAASGLTAALSRHQQAELWWLQHWMERLQRRPIVPRVKRDTVRFGLLDFRSPDWPRSSRSGDEYLETVVVLDAMAAEAGNRLEGDHALVELAADLRRGGFDGGTDESVRPVHVQAIHRDASASDAVPPRTWAIFHGALEERSFEFPWSSTVHRNLNPIFLSFEVRSPRLLTADVVRLLEKCAPIGCRDWYSVALLVWAGVPAFYSGSLALLFRGAERTSGDSDLATQANNELENGSHFASASGALADVLRSAMRQLPGVECAEPELGDMGVNSRLATFAMGGELSLGKWQSTPVADALRGMSVPELRDVQASIDSLLRNILGEVARGGNTANVYARWRKLCAPAVRLAQSELAEAPPPRDLPFDVAESVASIRANSRSVRCNKQESDEIVHVALAVDAGMKSFAPVAIASMVQGASRPLRFHIMCRDHSRKDMDAVESLFPDAEFVWYPFDAVDYGKVRNTSKRISVSTMDRLLLPALLPEVRRVVYFDIDAICLADIADLYDVELGNAPLAAKNAVSLSSPSGMSVLWSHARRLDSDLRREYLLNLARAVPRDFRFFNAGILVLNLQRMRTDRFPEIFLPWVTAYGLNDQDVLNLYASDAKVRLDGRWNTMPAQESIDDPWVIHWAGPRKPWGEMYVPYRELWKATEELCSRKREEAMTNE